MYCQRFTENTVRAGQIKQHIAKVRTIGIYSIESAIVTELCERHPRKWVTLEHISIELSRTIRRPNSPGYAGQVLAGSNPSCLGSLYFTTMLEGNLAGSSDPSVEHVTRLELSLDKGNAIYGSSDTVQSASLRSLVLIRSY